MIPVDILAPLMNLTTYPKDGVAAMRDRWEEVAPGLLALMGSLPSDGQDVLSDEQVAALFFGLFMAGEKRDQRFHAPLREFVVRAPDLAEDAFGDEVVSSCCRILISTYAGEMEPLVALACNPEANDDQRAIGLETVVDLAKNGMIDRDALVEVLRRVGSTLGPGFDYFPYVWVTAVADYQVADLVPLARRALAEEWIEPALYLPEEFEDDLAGARAGKPFEPGRFTRPIGNLDDELSRYVYGPPGEDDADALPTEEEQALLDAFLANNPDATGDDLMDELDRIRAEREAEAYQRDRLGRSTLLFPDIGRPTEPVTNPFKGVGRNDPCPCGSGKKFKKCCLV